MSDLLVSVCVPTLGREEKLQRLLGLIPETAGWEHEVIVERDSFDDRQGVPRTLARAVAKAKGSFVSFLGNDTIPHPGWLRIAMECMLGTFPDGVGLVGFNDLYWADGRCLHWVGAQKILPLLDGEWFCTQYNHCGVDDELIGRCRQIRKYVWCPEAVVAHDHFTSGAPFDEVYAAGWSTVERDRATLKERSERMGFAPWLPK
jgi:hypothetical protein